MTRMGLKVLDLSAGNRAIWYNKKNPRATYVDIRPEVEPDIVADTRSLPLEGPYDLIVFDPPHVNFGATSRMAKNYGHFTTKQILETVEGTAKEAHRVARSDALMIFKWNDHDIRLQRVLDLMPQWEPLFGHLTKDGPGSKTYWVTLRRCDGP